ncbi:hypothetical protein GCM10007940_00270 [Portibacter lacus]|uniref:Uncharacterized protein n=1 Tax=Portibacter lacus TaxID=1099794 RepID=A0AA37SLH3_9BACT|nr:hypothetical protein GCM10007940_00270 [Portibacter lacus]
MIAIDEPENGIACIFLLRLVSCVLRQLGELGHGASLVSTVWNDSASKIKLDETKKEMAMMNFMR